jgi:threonine aldolase
LSAAEHAQPLAAHLKHAGIVILPNAHLRLVTHLDVSAADVGRIIAAFRGYFAGR